MRGSFASVRFGCVVLDLGCGARAVHGGAEQTKNKLALPSILIHPSSQVNSIPFNSINPTIVFTISSRVVDNPSALEYWIS